MKPLIERCCLLLLTMILLGRYHNCKGNPAQYNKYRDGIDNRDWIAYEGEEDSTINGNNCVDNNLNDSIALNATEELPGETTVSKLQFVPASRYPAQNTNITCSQDSPEGCQPPTYVCKYVEEIHGCHLCAPWIITSPVCPCSDCWNARNKTIRIPCPCKDCLNGCFTDDGGYHGGITHGYIGYP